MRSFASMDHFDSISISLCLINTFKLSIALIALCPSGESKILQKSQTRYVNCVLVEMVELQRETAILRKLHERNTVDNFV